MTLHSLPLFVKLAGQPVIVVGEGTAAEAKRRLLQRAGAVIVDEAAADSERARFAIVVDDDAAVHRLKSRGVLVNAVDRPELCDFTLPAIIDRAPVVVAIGTGGASAGLAAALRQRLETLLPAKLGRLAEALYAARSQWRARFPSADERRRAIAAALAEHGPLDPLRVHGADVIAAPTDHITPPPSRADVALRSRDPDDLTLREARLLAQADRLYHGPDIPAAILDRARADAPRIECATPPVALPPGFSVDVRMG